MLYDVKDLVFIGVFVWYECLFEEQKVVIVYVVGFEWIVVVIGCVGVGKMMMMKVVCEVWEVVGYCVVGGVFVGKVVEGLEKEVGIVFCMFLLWVLWWNQG